MNDSLRTSLAALIVGNVHWDAAATIHIVQPLLDDLQLGTIAGQAPELPRGVTAAAVRAAAASAFESLCAEWRPTLDAWRTGGLRVVALAAAGDTLLDDADLSGPIAICAGAEGAGLPASVLALADQHIRIPMRAPVESLNVGVAVSLVLFEAARQRGRSR